MARVTISRIHFLYPLYESFELSNYRTIAIRSSRFVTNSNRIRFFRIYHNRLISNKEEIKPRVSNLYYLESSKYRGLIEFHKFILNWIGSAVAKIRSNQIHIYICVCVPCFNGTWKQLECRHVRRFACKEERAKCNLDYHSNQDLCTASAYASGCDSLENCLRCWYWKFMRITSAGDAEVTARARASPRPKPFVADENYTPRNRLTALLSMTPPFIYIFLFLSFSLVFYSFFSILFLPYVETFEKGKREEVSSVIAFTRTIFSYFFPFILAIMSLYCLFRCFT